MRRELCAAPLPELDVKVSSNKPAHLHFAGIKKMFAYLFTFVSSYVIAKHSPHTLILLLFFFLSPLYFAAILAYYAVA